MVGAVVVCVGVLVEARGFCRGIVHCRVPEYGLVNTRRHLCLLTIFALGEEVFRSASTRMSNAIGYWDKDSGSRLYAIGTRQTDLCA